MLKPILSTCRAAVRDAIPKAHALAKAEFTTIRLRLLKVAARVTETASWVRIAFASACPDAVLFRYLAASIKAGRALSRGASGPANPLPPLQRTPHVQHTPR